MTFRERLRLMREDGRLTRYCLIASLAFNLLIVGVFVGAVAGHDRGSRYWNPSGISIRPLISALPHDKKHELLGKLREVRNGEANDARAILGQNVEMLASAIEADPYDAEAVHSAFQQQRDSLGQLGERGHSAIVEVISELSPTERIALAEAFRDNVRSRKWRHGKGRE